MKDIGEETNSQQWANVNDDEIGRGESALVQILWHSQQRRHCGRRLEISFPKVLSENIDCERLCISSNACLKGPQSLRYCFSAEGAR